MVGHKMPRVLSAPAQHYKQLISPPPSGWPRLHKVWSQSWQACHMGFQLDPGVLCELSSWRPPSR